MDQDLIITTNKDFLTDEMCGHPWHKKVILFHGQGTSCFLGEPGKLEFFVRACLDIDHSEDIELVVTTSGDLNDIAHPERVKARQEAHQRLKSLKA
jgi:hypothetical protein